MCLAIIVSTFRVFQLWRHGECRKPLFVLSVLVCLASVCFIQSLNNSAFDKRGLKEFLTVFSLETLVKYFLSFAHFRLFKTSRQEFQHQIAQHSQRRHRRTKTASTIWVLQVGFRGWKKRRPRSWGVLVQCRTVPRCIYQKQGDCGQGRFLGGSEKCDALSSL